MIITKYVLVIIYSTHCLFISVETESLSNLQCVKDSDIEMPSILLLTLHNQGTLLSQFIKCFMKRKKYRKYIDL